MGGEGEGGVRSGLRMSKKGMDRSSDAARARREEHQSVGREHQSVGREHQRVGREVSIYVGRARAPMWGRDILVWVGQNSLDIRGLVSGQKLAPRSRQQRGEVGVLGLQGSLDDVLPRLDTGGFVLSEWVQ